MTTKKRAARTTHAYTIKEAAEQLGIGTTQVSQWRAKGLLAEFPDGSLDVAGTWTNANRALDLTRGGKPDRGYGGRPRAPQSHRGELKAVGITRARIGKRRRGDEFLPDDLEGASDVQLEAESVRVCASRVGGAPAIFAEFPQHGHAAGVNKGQFSAWELLAAALDVTGPADVQICTWTVSGEAVADCDRLLRAGAMKSLKWILDVSLRSREPEYCAALVQAFGAESIRTTRNHAKWIVIRNAQWSLVIRGSMNFGSAPRMEYFEVSDDRRLADFLSAIAAELWERAPVWNFEADGDGLQFESPALVSAQPPASDRLTTAEIADVLKLSKRAVTRMRTAGVLTFDDDGCTTVERAQAELAARAGSKLPDISDLGDGVDFDDPDGIVALKMAEAREKVRKLRLQNEVLEKSLIPRDMVCEIFADGMAAVRSALTSWPVRWRHKFVGLQPDEIERIIRGEVNAILKELSDALAADKLDPDK